MDACALCDAARRFTTSCVFVCAYVLYLYIYIYIHVYVCVCVCVCHFMHPEDDNHELVQCRCEYKDTVDERIPELVYYILYTMY